MKNPSHLIDGREFYVIFSRISGMAGEPIEISTFYVDNVVAEWNDIKDLLKPADRMAIDYILEGQNDFNQNFDVDAWIR